MCKILCLEKNTNKNSLMLPLHNGANIKLQYMDHKDMEQTTKITRIKLVK